jgi:ABC-type multidrug transport system fused ATPase/permease subunit
VGSLQERFIALEMAFALLDTEPTIRNAPDAARVDQVRGEVIYDGVTFTYDGREHTLEEISFHVRPGEVVGIVGPTGAGKSTLVSLLLRLYDPADGRVLLDGQDVRTLELESLRSQISIVLQEPLLFSGTIAQNIRYGRLDASMDEIVEAARAANAHDFIEALPDGYESHIGEKGVGLSGGERQRISVARAFLKNAPVLVLDEPTSSIDSRTEGVILDALDRLMEGRTTFMIAHRLSTIRRPDRVLVLDGGRLVEEGTPQELLARDGLFRQLWDAQMGGADENPTPGDDGAESATDSGADEGADDLVRAAGESVR